MKVKEYLINRILKLEEQIKTLEAHELGTSRAIQEYEKMLNDDHDKLDMYEMERAHIKQIITCNLVPDNFRIRRASLHIDGGNIDLITLLTMLDIKQGDYFSEDIIPKCSNCVFKNLGFHEHPCDCCNDNSEFVGKKEDNNAKTTD